MMTYESKKKPGTFLTTDGIVDDKTKTLFVTVDGKEKRISIATLKRWWKKVEESIEEPTAEEAETEEILAEEAETEEIQAEEAETEETQAEEAEAEETQEAETEESETEEIPANEAKAEETQAEETQAEESADGSMKMSETIKVLEDIFDKLKGIYFDGRLVKPVITVQSTPRAYGHCSTKKIWKNEEANEAMYEINIGAEFLDRPIENIAATLMHEMVHLHCMENGIADTCQKGRYHNGTFKKECEARGLAVEYDRANGYAYTSPTDEFAEKLKEAGVDMEIKFAHIAPTSKRRAKTEKATYKYVCPCCGQRFRTSSILNIKCGNCDMTMERA